MTDDDKVTPGQIRQYRALKTTTAALDAQYGAGNWGDDQVADYIRLKRRAKADAAKIEAAAQRQGLVPVGLTPQSFDERYRAYELAYDNLTPNDRTSLKTLVALEIQIEQAQVDMLIQENVLNRAKIGDSIATLSREHRQLQDNLGISRARRKQETNAQDEVNRLRDGARAFVENLGVLIACGHCASKFEMGWILFHFRDDVPWTFTFTCPRCNEVTTLTGVHEPERHQDLLPQ